MNGKLGDHSKRILYSILFVIYRKTIPGHRINDIPGG